MSNGEKKIREEKTPLRPPGKKNFVACCKTVFLERCCVVRVLLDSLQCLDVLPLGIVPSPSLHSLKVLPPLPGAPCNTAPRPSLRLLLLDLRVVLSLLDRLFVLIAREVVGLEVARKLPSLLIPLWLGVPLH